MIKHRARKRFGQNFLVDNNIIHQIIRAVDPKPDQQLIEIGPGQAALTKQLLPHCQQLDVIELDRDLIPGLEKLQQHDAKLHIHQADALKFEINSIIPQAYKARLIGNLPYNISTPLIFHLLQSIGCIADMHFMLQKEVVDRMVATQGRDYGRLSVMIQYYCQVTRLLDVPPSAFRPQPKVQSSVVRLTPHAELPHPCQDVATLSEVVRLAFNQRRKTIHNALKSVINDQQLLAAGIDPSLRAENLSLKNYVIISDIVYNNGTAFT